MDINPPKNGTHIGSDRQICKAGNPVAPGTTKPQTSRAMKHALLGHGSQTEETNILSLHYSILPLHFQVKFMKFILPNMYNMWCWYYLFTFRFHVCFPGCCVLEKRCLLLLTSEQDPKNSKIHQGRSVRGRPGRVFFLWLCHQGIIPWSNHHVVYWTIATLNGLLLHLLEYELYTISHHLSIIDWQTSKFWLFKNH